MKTNTLYLCVLIISCAALRAQNVSPFTGDPFAGVTYTPEEKEQQAATADKLTRAAIASQARRKWGEGDLRVVEEISAQTKAYERVEKIKRDGIPGFDVASVKSIAASAAKQDATHFDFVFQLVSIKKALPEPEKARLTTLTVRGKEYKDVRIIRATSAELRIMHAAGTAAIPMADLPDDIRETYRFPLPPLPPPPPAPEPSLADEADEPVTTSRRQLSTPAAKLETFDERERRYYKREELRAQIAKSAVNVRVRLTQVIPARGIALGYGSAIRRATPADYDLRPTKIVDGMILEPEAEDPICIVGLPSSYVDGDSLAGWFYPCGTHSYTAVSGAVKTVRKYGATAQAAEKELSKP